MSDNNLTIIPGVKLGKCFLNWDISTLISHLPKSYTVKQTDLWWNVYFDNYVIKIRKFDLKIDWIFVTGIFKENYLNKLTSSTTLQEIEEEFGPTDFFIDTLTLPNHPGISIWTEDEQEDDESEDGWKQARVISIAINDFKFVWDAHFTQEDYKKMGETKYPCPFPSDKLIS